ncbi:MAG TPA: SIS domain-containing protein [Tepidisphaeraceae bacterium]|jgi:D-sedoheptulose 7-phosphate isomerase|nr:SIS domain-containing protein [Tepidisphaeraceae bacterium]
MIKSFLDRALADVGALLPKIALLEPQAQKLCDAMLSCWHNGSKVMFAGNGGSCTDAMHFAEELMVRFQKKRRALGAIALCDPSVLTCAGNDFGFETIFSRQIEGIGRAGDLFVGLTTSGNSPNMLRAFEAAKKMGILTCGLLGRDGGKVKELCDIPIVVPSDFSSRIQEAHKILYHVVCEWVDSKID